MNKKILDACCGSKMFWFDKENEEVVINGVAYIPKEQSNIEQIQIMEELKIIKSTILEMKLEQDRLKEIEMDKSRRAAAIFEAQSQMMP